VALFAVLAIIAVAVTLGQSDPKVEQQVIYREYPVQGVDVSAHQGKIDWSVLGPKVDFAFIKATEGATFVDPNFAANWAGANAAHVNVGAYHFFRFDVPAADQAANFIANVPVTPGMLPPVIDFELYGDLQQEANMPDRTTALASLSELASLLAAHYGVKPIIYANSSTYSEYLSGQFKDDPIWVAHYRDDYHTFVPQLSDGKTWTFWQYSESGQLPGYSGGSASIDLDVFNGTREEWNQFLGAPS
jgi:lysozyme